MNTLGDAWDWYQSTRKNLERMQRLGKRYWDEIPWETATLARDDAFRLLGKEAIEAETTTSLAPIDDLAVLVLFSVFEAMVRGYVIARLRPEADRLADPILRHAADDALRGVEEGGFFRHVLEPLKEQGLVSPDVITQVNQVRDYRNWVAHGRRDRPRNQITPNGAFFRLKEFLDILKIPVASEPSMGPPTDTTTL